MNGKILFSKVYNRKNQLNKEGKAPIEICCYLNQKRRYISTGIFIAPNDWNDNKKIIRQNSDLSITQNKILDQQINQLENLELDCYQRGEPPTLAIVDRLKQQPTDKSDFLAFVSQQLADKKGVSFETIKAYRQLLKYLTDWKGRVSFADLTYSFVDSFSNHLLNKGLNQNSVNKHLRSLRAMINSAINNGLMDLNKYPFRNYRIKHVAANRAHLTPEEIERIETLTIENPTLAAVRDMYLFSVYTGLRYSDIIRLTAENIVTTGNKTFLTLTMQKTALPLNIPLHALFDGKPITLINKYLTDRRATIFPPYTNGYINENLRQIAQLADIKKHITFHTARHTAATYLLNKGVNIVIVQKILGHTNVSTTEIYAKMLGATIEKELTAIFK